MDKLKSMQVFVRLIELNSFARAAEVLDMSRGGVTRHVQDLEQWLGTTLINRTTRKMQITTSGAEFYEQSCRILGEMLEVEAMINHLAHSPRGTLRIYTSGWLSRLLVMPVLSDFYAAHPGVSLSLSIGDAQVDPIEQGFDCVLRTGALPDSSNIARALGDFEQVVVASSEYLQSKGRPKSTSEQDGHIHIAGRDRNKRVPTHSGAALVINDLDVAMQACLEGVGIVTVPKILAHTYLATNRLIEVPASSPIERLPAFAVLPPGKRVSPLARAFTQWVASNFPASSAMTDSVALPTEPVVRNDNRASTHLRALVA